MPRQSSDDVRQNQSSGRSTGSSSSCSWKSRSRRIGTVRLKEQLERLPRPSSLARRRVAFGLKELERDAEAPRRVYETMLERYQRAREQEKLLLDSARIIGPAQIPIRQPSNVSAASSCSVSLRQGPVRFWRWTSVPLSRLFRPGYQNADRSGERPRSPGSRPHPDGASYWSDQE